MNSVIILAVLVSSSVYRISQAKVFNVHDYGAKADGSTDNNKAFMSAWKDACHSMGKNSVVTPQGMYMLSSVTFIGPCKGEISFVVKGTLLAPKEPHLFETETWIDFRYVDRLAVTGGGFLDGQGPYGWKYNDCATNPNCPALPSSLRFEFVTNSSINHIKSINSMKQHISLFGCSNIDIHHVRISAPETSPNTDGIHIGESKDVTISKTSIGTGDDCIAMISGSENIHISEVVCGPGHGISIGSLGRGGWTDPVRGISVVNSTIIGAQNGVRIKTWSPSSSSRAEDIVFQNIRMENVNNPIFIDQDYCPFCSARKMGDSRSLVEIRNARFENIWGSSSSKIAVSLQCSKVVPCKGVKLVNINLDYLGGPADAACYNVYGEAYGKQSPSGCL